MKELHIPANPEAEMSLIATLLYNPRQLAKVLDILKPDHFHEDNHAVIYQAMQTLASQHRACSPINVADELKRTNQLEQIGGRRCLDDFVAYLDAFGTIEETAAIVKRTSQMRHLYDAARQIATAALAQDETAIEQAEQLIMDIALDGAVKPVATFSSALERYVDILDQRRDDFANGVAGGAPTGLYDLDKLLGGMWKSRLYTLAARPGLGKSSLALNIALYIASHAKHALFFSLEMDEEEIIERAVSSASEINQTLLRDGDISEPEMRHIRKVAHAISPYDLKIDDRTYLLADIRTKARQEHLKQPLDLMVVDYLQLVDVSPASRAKNESRAEEVAKISKGLKKLARELKVPILALAQMNRESERRGNALPQLSDLGESSGIEKDSDCVMFIYCNDLEATKRDNNEPYNLEIIVRKHRHGRLGSVPLRFRPCLTRFEDQERSATYEEPG